MAVAFEASQDERPGVSCGLPPQEQRQNLARVARTVSRLLGGGWAYFCVGDPASPCVIAGDGAGEASLAALFDFLTIAAQQDAPLLVPDAVADPRFQRSEAVAALGVRMVVAYPLLDDDGGRIGFLCALAQEPRSFSNGDREALDDLVGLAILALRKWRKERLLARAEQALRSFQQGLASDQKGDHLGMQAAFMAQTLALDGVVIAEFADKGRTRMRTVSRYWRGAFLPELEFAVAGTPVETFCSKGQRTWRQGLPSLFPGARPLLDGVEGCILIPLRDASAEVYGVMMVFGASPFEDTPLIEALLPVVAAGVEARYKARRAEHELRMREAEIRAMYDHTTDLIFILDRDFRYINVNPAYAAALGQPIEAILGQRSGYSLPPHAMDRAIETNAWILETGQPVVYDIVMECALGMRSFSVLKFPYRDQEGAIAGVSGIARDISDRKALERQKSAFVTALSHEIRTPLFAIQNALHLLSAGCCEPGSQKGRRMLSIAERNAERLVRLAHDVLLLEGLEAGAIPFVAEECDAVALMEEAAAYLEGLAEQAGLSFSITAPPLRFEASAERIMQVLVNLLSNAIKFSPAGAQVSLEATEDGEEIRFAVRDRGRGIPGEDLYRVFDPFHQVQTDDGGHGGIGMGLPISREIVLAHGGRIWVESELGRGSAFYVALPFRTRLRLKETRPR